MSNPMPFAPRIKNIFFNWLVETITQLKRSLAEIEELEGGDRNLGDSLITYKSKQFQQQLNSLAKKDDEMRNELIKNAMFIDAFPNYVQLLFARFDDLSNIVEDGEFDCEEEDYEEDSEVKDFVGLNFKYNGETRAYILAKLCTYYSLLERKDLSVGELKEYLTYIAKYLKLSAGKTLYEIDRERWLDENEMTFTEFLNVFGKKENFDDVFLDKTSMEFAYQVLIDEGIVDENFTFKPQIEKSVFAIWLGELKKLSPSVIRNKSQEEYTKLLNAKIVGLNITRTTLFNKTSKKASDKFEENIRYFLKKLAQSSQSN